MSSSLIAGAIEEIAGKISFFEDENARKDLLKQLINIVVTRTGADMGAVFVHDEEEGQLVLRAGFEKGELWEDDRYTDSRTPLRFGLEGNEVGRAFTERRIIWLSYAEDEGDHPYRSKVLIPILRGPMQTGVLILAREGERGFDREDEEGLMAAASRFGDVLTDASALLACRENADGDTERRWSGVSKPRTAKPTLSPCPSGPISMRSPSRLFLRSTSRRSSRFSKPPSPHPSNSLVISGAARLSVKPKW
jgi:hypothetical protein